MKRRWILALVTMFIGLMSLQGSALAAPTRISSITDHVSAPFRVCVDTQGNLYETETANNAVRIYNRKGQYLKSLTVPKPLGIAVDGSGKIYVGLENKGVDVYNPDFTFAYDLQVFPAIQCQLNNSCTQLDSMPDKLKKITMPKSIAIDNNGRVYVVDSAQDTVHVFEGSSAQHLFNMGSTYDPIMTGGSPDGKFSGPTALTINDASGEVYVADLVKQMYTAPDPNSPTGTTGYLMSTARIQVFNRNTKEFIRSFGQNSIADATSSAVTFNGPLTTPVDIALDRMGKVYVLDATSQSSAVVFDSLGSLVDSTGAAYVFNMSVPLRLPLGIAITKNNLAYITSQMANSIEVYALDGYTTMEIAPSSIAFQERFLSPASGVQSITIANSGSGPLVWTASKSADWIVLDQAGGTVPSGAASGLLGVSVDMTKVSPGNFTGSVTITSDYGQSDTIPVTLTVLPAPAVTLISDLSSLAFSAKKGSTSVLTAPLKVQVSNIDSLNWSTSIIPGGSEPATWLSILTPSGSTSTDTMVVADPRGLSQGLHEGIIFLHAPGAMGDGSQIAVSMNITVAATRISVTTNRPEASYRVVGSLATTYSGTGENSSWENAPAGDYTVTFDAVSGFKKPAPQTKTLTEGGSLAINGVYVSYMEMAARKTIITAKGPWAKNDARIKTYKADSSIAGLDVTPLDTRYGANVASGDIDGDGIAELIVGAGSGPRNAALVRMLRADKTVVAEFTPFSGVYGVNVAAADLNGDGIAEVIVASAGGAENPAAVKVYAYDKTANDNKGAMLPTGVEFTAYAALGANIAVADTEGNSNPHIITAPCYRNSDQAGDSVKIWAIDTSNGMGNWSAAKVMDISVNTRYGATVASGDMDADGKDEIIIGTSPDPKADRKSGERGSSVIHIVSGNGTEMKTISVFDERNGVNIAVADLDGDGIPEIIAGTGPDPRSSEKWSDERDDTKNKKNKVDDDQENSVKVISGATGNTLYTITPFEHVKYGVHVAVGDLGL